MPVLLFGAGGQLGADLERECLARGYRVRSLGRQQVDVKKLSTVRNLIRRSRPRWVINATGYNDVDAAESDRTTALNVNGAAVQAMAQACDEVGATLLCYSSDFVFDGRRKTPYTERMRANPLSMYGISKLVGDLHAQNECASHYVLRVAGVYGPAGRHTQRGNFAEFVLRQCAAGDSMQVVEDRIATPTFGPALASRSLDVLERGIPHGLYNLGGGEPISWYEFARKVAAAAGASARIEPIRHTWYVKGARRPRYAALSNAKVERKGIAPMPGIDEALREYMLLRERRSS